MLNCYAKVKKILQFQRSSTLDVFFGTYSEVDGFWCKK